MADPMTYQVNKSIIKQLTYLQGVTPYWGVVS